MRFKKGGRGVFRAKSQIASHEMYLLIGGEAA